MALTISFAGTVCTTAKPCWGLPAHSQLPAACLMHAGMFNSDGTGILAHGFTGALHIWRREGGLWVPQASAVPAVVAAFAAPALA